MCSPDAASPSDSLLMTLPSISRLRLIWLVSTARDPSAPLFASRSEPAKSTKLSVDSRMAPPSSDSWRLSMDRRTMVWLRLDCSFILVLPICFLAPPLASSCRSCSRLVTRFSYSPCSTTPLSASSLSCTRTPPVCSRCSGGASRSLNSSL